MTAPNYSKSNASNSYNHHHPYYPNHSFTPQIQDKKVNQYPANSVPDNKPIYDQLSVTLAELDKAIVNAKMMYQTAHSVGLFELLQTTKNNTSISSLIKLLKSIDYQQVYSLLQSPIVQQMLSDPNFHQLFAPDTGTTPGTSLEDYKSQTDESTKR